MPKASSADYWKYRLAHERAAHSATKDRARKEERKLRKEVDALKRRLNSICTFINQTT